MTFAETRLKHELTIMYSELAKQLKKKVDKK